jgi:hypothetical protein
LADHEPVNRRLDVDRVQPVAVVAGTAMLLAAQSELAQVAQYRPVVAQSAV